MPTVNFHLGDCMEFMRSKPDKYYDLAVVDPEYGIDAANMNLGRSQRKLFLTTNYIDKDWDKQRPSEHYFSELFRVSKNQIICGGNYFADNLPISKGWVFWDKLQPSGISFGMGELIWTSFEKPIQKITVSIASGSNRVSSCPTKVKSTRIHPTQKPIQLYKELLKLYAKPGERILDTHGGSMSSAIACFDMGFDLDICELDPDYFKAGRARFDRHLNRWHEGTTAPINDPNDYSQLNTGLFAQQIQ